MLQYLVFLGAFVVLLGIFSYIKNTLKGRTKPNRITWLMWSIAPLIGTAAALSKGFSLSILPVFMAGFGPLLVLMASFKNRNSYWKLKKLDYACGGLSALSLVFWLITKEANIAIIFAITSDGLAAFPTILKAWKYPETEIVTPYLTGLFSVSTSFFAMRIWNFSELAYPVYLIFANLLIIGSILRGQARNAKKNSD